MRPGRRAAGAPRTDLLPSRRTRWSCSTGWAGLAGEGSNTSRRRHAFRRLPESALELRQAVSRLERSDEYRVLLHTAWRQPGAGGGRVPGVRLSTLRGAAAAGRFARGSGAAAAVEGTIRLRRQRSVYVDADLEFGSLEPRPASAGEEAVDGAAARDEGASPDIARKGTVWPRDRL